MATRPNISLTRPAIPKAPRNIRLTPLWGHVALNRCQVCDVALDLIGQELFGGLVGDKAVCPKCGRTYITELRL